MVTSQHSLKQASEVSRWRKYVENIYRERRLINKIIYIYKCVNDHKKMQQKKEESLHFFAVSNVQVLTYFLF